MNRSCRPTSAHSRHASCSRFATFRAVADAMTLGSKWQMVEEELSLWFYSEADSGGSSRFVTRTALSRTEREHG